jgi:hypothetical protein
LTNIRAYFSAHLHPKIRYSLQFSFNLMTIRRTTRRRIALLGVKGRMRAMTTLIARLQ